MKTLDNNDYHIKFAMIQEYKKVLAYKKMYEDLIESFQYILSDLLNYSKKNRIDLPHREHIYRNIEKARELIEYRIEKTSSTTDENLQSKKKAKTDGDLTEPSNLQ